MIPLAFIQAWSQHALWPDLRQVEQDLIISKALCDLFSAPRLKGKIAFRGGTAINKLLFQKPIRVSRVTRGSQRRRPSKTCAPRGTRGYSGPKMDDAPGSPGAGAEADKRQAVGTLGNAYIAVYISGKVF